MHFINVEYVRKSYVSILISTAFKYVSNKGSTSTWRVELRLGWNFVNTFYLFFPQNGLERG